MAMSADDIVKLIEEGLPGSTVVLEDLRGDGDHYAAQVTYEGFKGLSRVQQHQMVYQSLKGRMGEALHALALQTRAPD